MTRILHLTAIALALSLPAAAQVAPDTAPFQMPRADEPAPDSAPQAPDAPSFLEGFLMDFLDRAQPHLQELAEDMGGLVDEYRPALQDIGRLMDDIGNYELPPERLANGDIIIRRKPGAPPPPTVENLMPRSRDHLPPAERPLELPPLLPQIEL